MQLYIGSPTKTKLNQILSKYQDSKKNIICDGSTATEEKLFIADVIYNFELFIKRQLDSLQDVDLLPIKLLLKNPYVTIVCQTPKTQALYLEKNEHIYYKKIHEICHELSKRAQKVINLNDNKEEIIKDKPHTLLCSFIRHGKTKGNLSKRYIGVTDEVLCDEGIHELMDLIKQGAYPTSSRIYVSPMIRCTQTAELIYPEQKLLSCDALKECNFGTFENKNYKELQVDPHYQEWVDSNGTLPFPAGETPSLFTKRCLNGFFACIKHTISQNTSPSSWVTFVVHGGTIMSIMSELTFPKGDYFSFQVANGQGYLCEYELDTKRLTILDKIPFY